ncbi:menaquinone-dependent protoporphyrinogen IX dehydrogenase [Breoghania sp.]|uniref:menaquinone-dependent protoporphyrinogen IX dehydrogenase n=1 Tax=Breoghania sp. TaxID=2065378 RepID=UPI002AA5EF57|nr:menaquinone-dependent protoporphyrinogen IX dehydrogenase [Breoghania sp.]
MTTRIDIFYASHDGHTLKIARFIEKILMGAFDGKVTLHSAKSPDLEAERIGQDSFTVVIAPIRYGYPLREAEAFLRANKTRIAPERLAMLLVCLTARKPNRQSVETNGYLRKWLARHGLTPKIAASIAGKLDYPRYRPFDRFMIRLIMRMSRGPTDPTTQIEYTDWAQVEALSQEIARLAQGELTPA